LEAIATGLVSGYDAIKEYVKCTLLYRTMDKKIAYNIMNSALKELADKNLLQQNDDESYGATNLGQAVVASAFAPEDGLFVYEELKRALQAFVMDGDMHVFYMFTPLQVAITTQVDWPIFRDQLDNLDESGLRALQFVGVQPGFVNRMYVKPNITQGCANEYTGFKAVRFLKKKLQNRLNWPLSIVAPTLRFSFEI
jgi:DNA polymerase theta